MNRKWYFKYRSENRNTENKKKERKKVKKDTRKSSNENEIDATGNVKKSRKCHKWTLNAMHWEHQMDGDRKRERA